MSFFKRVWGFLQQTEVPQPGASQEEILTRICAILSSLDDQQQCLLTLLQEFERRMDEIGRQQLAMMGEMLKLYNKGPDKP